MCHRILLFFLVSIIPALGFAQLVLENLNNGRTKPLAGNRKTVFTFQDNTIPDFAKINFREYTTQSFNIKGDSIEMVVEKYHRYHENGIVKIWDNSQYQYCDMPAPTKMALTDLKLIKVSPKGQDFFLAFGTVMMVLSALDAVAITPLLDGDLRSMTQKINAVGFGAGLGLVLWSGKKKKYNIGVHGDPTQKMWGVLR